MHTTTLRGSFCFKRKSSVSPSGIWNLLITLRLLSLVKCVLRHQIALRQEVQVRKTQLQHRRERHQTSRNVLGLVTDKGTIHLRIVPPSSDYQVDRNQSETELRKTGRDVSEKAEVSEELDLT